MMQPITLVSFWAVNSICLFLSSFIFSGSIVVGNARFAPILASMVSGLLLALINGVTVPVVTYFNIKIKQEWQWTFVFLGVNTASAWLLARYADLTGLGILNFWMAVILGVILTLLQWGVWKLVNAKNTS